MTHVRTLRFGLPLSGALLAADAARSAQAQNYPNRADHLGRAVSGRAG